MRERAERELANSVLPAQPEEILILTASTGAGHDSVASALQEAIPEVAPQTTVRVLDPLSGGRSNGAMSLGSFYDATVARAPWLWEWVYRATNHEWVIRYGMPLVARLWGRRLRTAIQSEHPGMVVAVHPLCVRLAGAVLRTIPGALPLHCVVTDLVTIHRCWACEEVDAFYVATSDARDALIGMGISAECIQVTGLPLRASFARTPHAPAGEAPSRVLLLGGGRPSRRLERVARALLASRLPLSLTVVCGRNRHLQRRLTRTLGEGARVLGWRDDIASLMRWSSVVVTKAGPTTVAEALSQARSVVIFQALKGQETGNIALAERIGSGCYVPDVEALTRSIEQHRQSAFEDLAQAAWWGGAARRVATHVLSTPTPGVFSVPGDHAEVLEVSGRTIRNPISGERMVIHQSGEQTGGKLLAFDLFLPPGGHVPARHVHPIQEERFTVLEGQMRFRLGWRRSILASRGDTIVVPPGTEHWFGNAGKGESHARVEVRPALRLQEAFERSAAMEVSEPFPGLRVPRLADLALFLIEFRRELAVPHVPASLVTAFLAPLAWLGRLRTHDAHHGSGP
ncbi:MAG: cupin domain-containing protein [Chloroflexota bacterium]|nr:cupin domain-containing protein [Chloroflexota bacterium]